MKMQVNLEGLHVRLRELRLTDLIDVYVNIRDKEVGRWSIPPPKRYAKNAVGQFIWMFAGHLRKTLRVVWQTLFQPKVRGEFKLGIVLKETSEVIGVVTLSQIDQQKKSAQIGFWIGKKYWGHGLTTEAVQLALEFGFNNLGLEEIEAWTFEKNVGSRKVMEKCGFKLDGVVESAYLKYNEMQNRLNYRILKSEYKNVSR